jgi:hypothetical protein
MPERCDTSAENALHLGIMYCASRECPIQLTWRSSAIASESSAVSAFVLNLTAEEQTEVPRGGRTKV